MLPLPWPVAPPENTTQAAAVLASHVQSRVVVTVNAPVPPPAGMLADGVSTETVHLLDDGAVIDTSVELQATENAAMATTPTTIGNEVRNV